MSDAFEHPGDTNHPAEFGFDLSIAEDRAQWERIASSTNITRTQVPKDVYDNAVGNYWKLNGEGRSDEARAVLHEAGIPVPETIDEGR